MTVKIPEYILLLNPAKLRLLEYLRLRGTEVNVNEIITARPSGLGIVEYTGRITDLRKQGHNIVNTRLNHYQLFEGKTGDELVLHQEKRDYQAELEELRKRYLTENDDFKKSLIAAKGKALKKLYEQSLETDSILKTVERHLF